METTFSTPFRTQISATQKKMQILKLREYIYQYLLQFEELTESEAYAIASQYPEYRIDETGGFRDKDVNYVNGRLEEIEKLQSEIYNLVA